jgi:hypothetical protein
MKPMSTVTRENRILCPPTVRAAQAPPLQRLPKSCPPDPAESARRACVSLGDTRDGLSLLLRPMARGRRYPVDFRGLFG